MTYLDELIKAQNSGSSLSFIGRHVFSHKGIPCAAILELKLKELDDPEGRTTIRFFPRALERISMADIKDDVILYYLMTNGELIVVPEDAETYKVMFDRVNAADLPDSGIESYPLTLN